MAAQPVKKLTRLASGGIAESVDQLGGIFTPVKGQRPVYSYGPKGQGGTRAVMFQCPVSAIPDPVWELLMLWRDCRTMKALPVAGGWLDQPKMVRRAFPVFEREMQAVEWADGPDQAAVAGLLAAGKGR